ncbi:hypothetical protein ACFRLW_27265 [Streptomyces sp. NPDC056728]
MPYAYAPHLPPRAAWQRGTGEERQAARELTAAAAAGALTVGTGDRYTLQDIAKAHDRVDAGGREHVLVAVP